MADFDGTPIEMVRGDTVKLRFAVTIADVPEDITAWTRFRLMAKASVDVTDAAAPVNLSTEADGGITVVDGPAGVGEVIIPGTATAGLTNRRQRLLAELQGTDASGYVWTLARWYLIVRPEVVQAT